MNTKIYKNSSRPLRTLLCVLCVNIFISSPIYAEEQFSLSMHGNAKYTATDTHLTYANPDAPKGGTLTRAAIGTFDTLNPFTIKGTAAQGLGLYYDRLMSRVWDEPFTLYPAIAKSYEMPDDRSEITFHLNTAAQFNDGTTITANDILFSYLTLRDHGRPNMRSVYKLIDHAEKIDDSTIKFVFTKDHDQETALIVAMMPILSEKYWRAHTFDSTTLEIPVSSSAYTIKNIAPGRSITYERNENYWGKNLLTKTGHNNFNTIKYDYYRDGSVAFEGFQSGDTSLHIETDLNRWRTGFDQTKIKSGDITKEDIAHERPERTRGIIFNTRRTPFDDIRVRQALSLVFDYESINKILYGNTQKQITSFYPNSELAFKDEPSQNPPSLRERIKKAGTLLEESEWVINDGKRTKNDQTLEFEILLGSPEDEKIALHFKKSLERLGITLNTRIADSAGFIDRLKDYDYDMVIHHWQNSLSPGTEQLLYWGCHAKDQKGSFNYAGICDQEVQRLASRVANAKNRKELINTIHKLDRILIAGHYIIPLFYAGADRYAYWNPLEHPPETPIYGAVVETWWMATPSEPSIEEESAPEKKEKLEKEEDIKSDTPDKPEEEEEETDNQEKTGMDDEKELNAD